MRRREIRQVIFLSVLCLLAGLSLASSRDFVHADDVTMEMRNSPSIYHPRSIADAIVLIAEMSTYLYHETRCGHMDQANADRLWSSMVGGVKYDFPGWRVTDDLVMRYRMLTGRLSVDDYSCTQPAVPNPTAITNNIAYYSARR